MKITAFILVVGVCLSSCGPAKAPAVPTPTPAVSQSQSDAKGPKDYKAIFGPDYKKGDIGHSKGVVIEKAVANNAVTIKHGVIHGIDRAAHRQQSLNLSRQSTYLLYHLALMLSF